MSDNPYAPPAADLETGGSPLSGGSGDFDIGQALSDGWANTWANFPLWLGVGIAGGLLVSLAAVTIIGLFLAVPVLLWGGTLFFLRMHDGGASLGDLFAGFSVYGQALVAMIVSWLILFLISLVGQLVQLVGDFGGIPVLSYVGLVISLGWGVGVMPRFYFATLYIVDQGMPPVEAIQRSWESTAPVWGKMIGLVILMGLVIAAVVAGVGIVIGPLVLLDMPAAVIGGIAALLGIGVIPLIYALTGLMWISAYRQLEGRPQQA